MIKISICIPAYKRVHYLKRLLDSISIQTYKNYEIIITDDSDDDTVYELAEEYKKILPVKYYRNTPALGTPKNWIAAMGKATGEWIKLIHDDDWFADEKSLGEYAKHTNENTSYIFSGYNAVYEKNLTAKDMTISLSKFRHYSKHPFLLFADNVIGPPSVVMLHHSVKEYYDTRLKWFVDLEYYISVLSKEPALYIGSPLINVSYNDSQVTNFCLRNPNVEIPEALYLINKHGGLPLKHIIVYDAWWRLFRNMNIRTEVDFKKYAQGQDINPILFKILNHQRQYPITLLKIGLISKILMSLSYIRNIASIK